MIRPWVLVIASFPFFAWASPTPVPVFPELDCTIHNVVDAKRSQELLGSGLIVIFHLKRKMTGEWLIFRKNEEKVLSSTQVEKSLKPPGLITLYRIKEKSQVLRIEASGGSPRTALLILEKAPGLKKEVPVAHLNCR